MQKMNDSDQPSWLREEEDAYPEWLIDNDDEVVGKIHGKISLVSKPYVELESSQINSPNLHFDPSWVRHNQISPKIVHDRSRVLSRKQVAKIIQSEDSSNLICCCMDAILCYFRLFHFICGIIITLTLVANCIVLSNDLHSSDIKDFVMRVYCVIFCCLSIFLEINFRFVLDYIRLMDNWIFRGLFYLL
jgi:hypothetical protein